MERKIRVGVVGLGWPGQRHLEAYLKHPQVEVIGLCDTNPVLLASIQSKYGVERGYGDFDDLLAVDELDAVSICTPNFLHQPMICAALAAGKHTLCEKPLAATLAQGELAAMAARESDRICMIGFSRRYREDSRLVKSLVDAGELGQIYHVRTGWLRRRWNPSVQGWFLSKQLSGGGPLIDLGVHMLDLALWFMGSPKAVSVSGSVSHHLGNTLSQTSSIDVEDLASAYIRLDNGATVILETSWVSYSGTGDHIFCQLMGTHGGAKIEFSAPTPVPPLEVYVDHAGVPLAAIPALPVGHETADVHFFNEISEFIAAIQENRQPASPIEHGLEILRILDAIYRSAETGAEIRLDRSSELAVAV
ncbi:MAG TPA: Gfo/Idh/MocA family oxidoreductase [Chloroflexota bacterium]|nr:Gfo/Idh/MocA family oxidoreductase [Chloroflexota bacterium]